ncbi:MAG: hypothetical protein ACFFCQ_06585 [Promethearchaeota archaeon]
MAKQMKCVSCGHEIPIPNHCGQEMHIEQVEGGSMLVCWMGPECGKQPIPEHCNKAMVLE